MKNLATAVIAVMQEVKGIEKNMQIGEGRMSYKGVADQEVKKVIGDAMAKHGLCILPIGVTPITKVDRWEEDDTYNKQPPYPKKTKQSVFTEVATKYLLLHESGESLELAGLGHGVDSQDKGAGKATTYALKYTLLYTFLVPTGKIDDADNTHSDDIQAPKGLSIAEIQKKLDVCKTINELNALFPTITPMTEAIKAMFSARKIQLK
jgi:hypothetical protein